MSMVCRYFLCWLYNSIILRVFNVLMYCSIMSYSKIENRCTKIRVSVLHIIKLTLFLVIFRFRSGSGNVSIFRHSEHCTIHSLEPGEPTLYSATLCNVYFSNYFYCNISFDKEITTLFRILFEHPSYMYSVILKMEHRLTPHRVLAMLHQF